mmetsp:Transcript_31613/g.98353  ORF Transcript_31613/g.98353 Transcript_31613/m.98353 type:complete len:203 (+) Transcript_31613:515-1123(+)
MSDRFEEPRLLVLLLVLRHPAEEAPAGVTRGAVGLARGPGAEGLEELDAWWRIISPESADSFGLDMEEANEAAAWVLLEGIQASLVGQHHVDAYHTRQRAFRSPLERAAPAAVALAVAVGRARELLHIVPYDVLDPDGGPDCIAAQGLVHALRDFNLGPGPPVVGAAADLEPVPTAALAPVGSSACLGQVLVSPLRDGAAQP